MDLQVLEPNATSIVLDIAKSGVRHSAALQPFLRPFPRTVSIDVAEELADECMRRFDNRNARERVESDAWLGPRIHAGVRLDRTEAASDGVWNFIASYALPNYVIWRWPGQSYRFISPDTKKHAIKRLWWGAELFRNGANYETSAQALAISDVANTYLGVRNVHNRGVALALLRYIRENEIGSRQSNALSTQLKTLSVTVALDSSWAARDDASMIDEKWLREKPDGFETLRAPSGPDDVPVSTRQLNAVFSALSGVIDLKRIREYRRGQSQTERSGED